jgi:hypothetical protein
VAGIYLMLQGDSASIIVGAERRTVWSGLKKMLVPVSPCPHVSLAPLWLSYVLGVSSA